MSRFIERLFGKRDSSIQGEQSPARFISPLDQKLAEYEKQQEEQQKEATIKAQNLEKIEKLRRDAIRLDFQNEVIDPAVKQWKETVPEDLIKLFDDFAVKARTKSGGPPFTKKMLVKVNGRDFPSTPEKVNDDWERKESILEDLRNPKSIDNVSKRIINEVSIEPRLVYTRKLDLEQSFSISIENSKITCHFGNSFETHNANTQDDQKRIIEIMVNTLMMTDLWPIKHVPYGDESGYDPHGDEGGVT